MNPVEAIRVTKDMLLVRIVSRRPFGPEKTMGDGVVNVGVASVLTRRTNAPGLVIERATGEGPEEIIANMVTFELRAHQHRGLVE